MQTAVHPDECRGLDLSGHIRAAGGIVPDDYDDKTGLASEFRLDFYNAALHLLLEAQGKGLPVNDCTHIAKLTLSSHNSKKGTDWLLLSKYLANFA